MSRLATLAFSVLIAATFAAAALADPARWRAEGWRTDFTRASIPLAEIHDGGPPRDGIPAIDRPQFHPASTQGEIDAREPVIMFPLDANARAYPLRILMWHEIVNDEVAGAPVTVTYCPLCNTALVFDRRVAGRVLDFGTTGKLRHSDLVMYDRQTDSWWQQFTGEAMAGELAGARLGMLPSRIISFGEFRAAHPQGPVLVPNDPNARRYGVNPYVGYDGRARPLPFFTGDLPVGMPAMARVVVARGQSGTVAVALAHLAARGTLTRQGFRFAWTAGAASALDRAAIAASRDVGAVSVLGPDGGPAVHDVTFAFVLLAFQADAVVLTEAGAIRLADGGPAQ